MSDTPKLRDKFEEWAEGKFNLLQGVHEYVSDRTEIAWEAWQAASKELSAVTEQRDSLFKALDVAQKAGIKLGEQRDRLAEVTTKLVHYIKKARNGDSPMIHTTIIEWIDEYVIKTEQALQSLNKPD